jgi:hypothetical protein
MRSMYRDLETHQRAKEQAALAARVLGTSPSLALERYAGTYADSLYGTVIVRLERGVLMIDATPSMPADLEHWNYDTFMAHYRTRYLGTQLMTFRLAPNGTVAALDLGGGVVLRKAP